MIKYKLYCNGSSDTILAAKFIIDNGCYMFYNSDGVFLCAWPVNSTIIENIVPYEKMKTTLINLVNSNVTEETTNKIINNVKKI